MKVAEAQVIIKAMQAAVDEAIAAGADEIELTSHLQALDDAARAELDAAIKRASS